MNKEIVSNIESLQGYADQFFDGSLHRLIIHHSIDNYENFVTLIDSTMLEAIEEIENNKNIYANFNEDSLTSVIVSFFRAKGFNAEHDSNRGGHCDIVVEKNRMQWLCEAKIYESYVKLYGGYQQLVTRYSTGRENATCGGLLIYNKKPNALDKLNRWKKRLVIEDNQITIDDHDYRCFYSTQSHPVSGLPYKVKHYSVLLHHEPKD